MDTTVIIVMIVSSLLSGIVGVIISAVYYRHHEKRRMKIDTFKRFFSNRYDLKGDEFSRAINEIFVVFHESAEVISALRAYHQRVTDRQNSEGELLKLHKAMCKEVNINFDKFNDSFFLTPFNTRPSSMAQHVASADHRETLRPEN
jgi:hypothetical protein